MVQKCKSCGNKIIRFPLWKGQEQGEKFVWDKIIWINLFKMNMESITMLILIVILVTAFKHDIAQCDEVMEDPCEFCAKSGCYDSLCLKSSTKPVVDWEINPDQKINLSIT